MGRMNVRYFKLPFGLNENFKSVFHIPQTTLKILPLVKNVNTYIHAALLFGSLVARLFCQLLYICLIVT